MAGEQSRIDFGMTDKGEVFVLTIGQFTDDGESMVYAYQVKHGVRTVGTYPTKAKAEAVARGLMG